MKKRIIAAQKIFSLLTSLNLVFQSVLGGLLFAPNFSFAQEVTPTPVEETIVTETLVTQVPAEPTVEPTSEPTAEPTAAEPTVEPIPSNSSGQAIEPTVEPTSEPTSAEPTAEPTGQILPEAASTDIPNIEVLPVPTPSPVVVEKECLAGQEIKDTVNEDWNIDTEKGLAETKEKVKLGVKYNFPLENKVSVTFKCLPKDESLRTSLKIQQIKVADLKLPEGVNPAGEYAYDITTGMQNGDFEYDVTLPKPEGQTANVSYIEKSVAEAISGEISTEEVLVISEEKLSQENETVKVEKLDHFTIYIVNTYRDADLTVSNNTFVQGDTVYVKGTTDDSRNLRLEISDTSGNIVKTCSENNALEITCDYLIPLDASLGTWQASLLIKSEGNWVSQQSSSFDVFINSSTLTPSTVQTIENSCMADLSKNLTCSANDVSIANVSNIQIIDSCDFPGDTVTFSATWDIQSTATQRYNIGLWFASGGQTSALNGSCSISTLPNNPVPPWYNFDNNACGDISSSGMVHPQITMTVYCLDPDHDNVLNLPYCTSWDQNSGTCGGPLDTVPGAPSKCNCEDGFEVPIVVPYSAEIEVIKNLVPSTDSGKFNLQINGVTEKADAGNGDSTEPIIVGAGTSLLPGETHTVGEIAGASTNLNDYTSSISCVDRGETTFDGGAPLTLNSAGPLNVDVDKDDDIVCTITNTLKTGSLEVVKNVEPDDQNTNWLMTVVGPTSFSDTLVGDDTTGTQIVNPGSYSITETAGSGTDLGIYDTSWSCAVNDIVTSSGSGTVATVSVLKNDTAICTFKNDLKVGTLTLVKTVVVDNNGTATKDDFQAYIETNPVPWEVPQTLIAGAYNVSESTALVGYAASDWGGDCAPDGSIILAPGQDATCTITNDDIQPKLTVTKVVENGAYGAKGVSDFPLLVDSTSVVSGVQNGFNANTYTVSETSQEGYSAVISGNCAPDGSITLNVGDVKACTITNTSQYGKIIVEKQTLPDGDQTAFTFTGNVAGAIGDGGKIEKIVIPGTYSVAEAVPAGWDFTNIVCSDNNSGQSVTGGALATINVESNETVTCTFTNTQRGHLQVTKVVDPSGDQTPFTINVSGTGSVTGDATRTILGGETEDFEVIPGTYSVTEDTVLGWYPSYSCQGIVVDPGETENCTINNTKYGSITIIKDAVPNDGQDFDFTVTGIPATGGFSLDDDSDATLSNTAVFSGLMPGSYTFAESGADGWVQSSVVCRTDGILDNTIGVGSAGIVLAAGENVTCTFTNTEQPKLTVTKIVTNDNGGAKVIADFPLFVDGNPVTSGIKNIFSAGAHTISETGDPGYTETIGGNCASDGTISLSPGDDLTCTITNNDNAPSLTLDKIVANDNGGTALEFAWTLTADGGNAGILSGPGAAGATDVVSDASFKAGTYTLSESTGPAGYTASSWSCIKNGIPVALTSPLLTLGLGDIATCTITNDDIVGQIKIIKNTIGGDGTFDFTVAGPTGQTPSITTSGGTGDTGFLNVDAGVYSISETVPAGWDLTGSSCTSGTPSSFTVSNGGRVDCTFTNTKFGSIQGKKFGDNNNNGVRNGSEPYLNNWQINLYDDEWSFVKGMQTGDDFTEAGNVATGQYLFINLKPENYYVCEELETGWVQTEPTSGPQNPNDNTYCHQVTVNPGDRVESILFGNFDLGEIQGRKFNDLNGNGQEDSGEPVINGWTIRLYNSDWQTAAPEQTTHFIVDYGQGRYRFENLNLGTYYICEVLQDGWTQTDPGGSEGFANQSPNNSEEAPRCRQAIIDESGDFISGKLFGNVNYGSISGMKYEDRNGNGEQNEGDNGLEEWTIELKQGETVIGSTTTAIDGTYSFQDIIAGDYQVCEVEQGGWTRTQPSDSECQPVTVVAGEDTSDVDFGNFLNGRIIACKYNDYAGNGQYESQDDQPLSNISFKLYQDVILIDTKQTELDGCVTFEDLTAGEYRIEEDYTDPDLNGYYSTDGTTAYENIVVTSGYDSQEEPFVFLNTPYRTISGQKYEDINGDGTKDIGEPGIEGWKIFIDYNNDGLLAGSEPWTETANDGNYEFTGLVSDSYTVAEVQQPGWTQTKPVSGSYSVDVHETVISENNDFGNFKLGRIQGYKYSDENDNGSWDQGEKGIEDWEICLGKVCTKTNADGYYEFTGLAWGDYEISEEHKVGWTQTEPKDPETYRVLVSSGTGLVEGRDYNFGNAAPIELTLEKSNDKPVAHTGDVVTYTLSIGISGRALSSMTLIDNSPDGFVYQTGTATVVGGTVNSVEPTLTNSGKTLTWTWSFVPGSSTVTVTYQTKIDSGNQAASYTNYAYVYGSGSPTSTDSEIVDSVVRIDPNISPSAQAGGEVLGAATELPASGSSTWYLILALSLIGAGFVIKKYSQKIN